MKIKNIWNLHPELSWLLTLGQKTHLLTSYLDVEARLIPAISSGNKGYHKALLGLARPAISGEGSGFASITWEISLKKLEKPWSPSPRKTCSLSTFRVPIFSCNGWFLWWTPRGCASSLSQNKNTTGTAKSRVSVAVHLHSHDIHGGDIAYIRQPFSYCGMIKRHLRFF